MPPSDVDEDNDAVDNDVETRAMIHGISTDTHLASSYLSMLHGSKCNNVDPACSPA